jgi:hypothetical protein
VASPKRGIWIQYSLIEGLGDLTAENERKKLCSTPVSDLSLGLLNTCKHDEAGIIVIPVPLAFVDSVFRDIYAYRITLADFSFVTARFNNVRFENGSILDFNNAVFFGEADFHRASFGSAALFKKAQFKETPNFGNATFQDRADFSRSTFQKGGDFGGATFEGDVNFNESDFNNL